VSFVKRQKTKYPILGEPKGYKDSFFKFFLSSLLFLYLLNGKKILKKLTLLWRKQKSLRIFIRVIHKKKRVRLSNYIKFSKHIKIEAINRDILLKQILAIIKKNC